MFVGIDVAKAELVVTALPTAERFTLTNDEGGVRALVACLAPLVPQLIVLEATGRYELLCVAALAAASTPTRTISTPSASGGGSCSTCCRPSASARGRRLVRVAGW